jgi:hypothetical protein
MKLEPSWSEDEPSGPGSTKIITLSDEEADVPVIEARPRAPVPLEPEIVIQGRGVIARPLLIGGDQKLKLNRHRDFRKTPDIPMIQPEVGSEEEREMVEPEEHHIETVASGLTERPDSRITRQSWQTELRRRDPTVRTESPPAGKRPRSTASEEEAGATGGMTPTGALHRISQQVVSMAVRKYETLLAGRERRETAATPHAQTGERRYGPKGSILPMRQQANSDRRLMDLQVGRASPTPLEQAAMDRGAIRAEARRQPAATTSAATTSASESAIEEHDFLFVLKDGAWSVGTGRQNKT